MKTRMVRSIAAMLFVATLGGSGCGYFLHPERRGNTSNVDAGTLVMDLLWLLPGVVPGVIALVIDFSSGAVYTGHRGAFISPTSWLHMAGTNETPRDSGAVLGGATQI
jgi:hypothetical protein